MEGQRVQGLASKPSQMGIVTKRGLPSLTRARNDPLDAVVLHTLSCFKISNVRPVCVVWVGGWWSRQGSSSPLLLFRKVTGEGMHTTTVPSEAVDGDLTIHLWLICSGVCGMDVADVRCDQSHGCSMSFAIKP